MRLRLAGVLSVSPLMADIILMFEPKIVHGGTCKVGAVGTPMGAGDVLTGVQVVAGTLVGM